MFKIAFIYPGYENLGIECLSANLKKNGFEVKLFLDPIIFSESGFLNYKPLASVFSYQSRLLRAIIDYQPDLVCFSVITDNYHWACDWAEKIKNKLSVPIVFGGIHATSVPEKVITQPFVDYVCVGEGDIALVNLSRALKDKQDTTSISNIWAKGANGISRNEIADPIEDLDNLPFPDKDLFYCAYPIFKDGYLISTSRGCPFFCAYCCNNVYHSLYKNKGKFVRRRSTANVLAELELAKNKYKPKFIHFVDEVFNYDKNWVTDFLSKYKESIRLPFSCFVFPDLVDPGICKLLKQAGCFKVQMGVQVIDDRKRKEVLFRSSTKNEITQAIKYLKDSGIFVTCDNILGFPDESEEELVALCYFYHQNKPDHCENFWLRYYPKAAITDWALENNYIDKERAAAIESGDVNSGLVRKPEHPDKKTYSHQFILFLNIYRYLPAGLRLAILKHKWYRLLPKVSVVFLLLAFRPIHHPKYDFNTIRTIRRYLYFCSRNIFPFLSK